MKTRRNFIQKSSLMGAGLMFAPGLFGRRPLVGSQASEPAILGGLPAQKVKWPEWPQWDAATMDEEILKVMRSGVWSRAGVTTEFEKHWAEMLGAKRCLAVVNGTNALIASLIQFGIGGGDEVIVPPYTFIASVQAILMAGAMPVFVDVDLETFQIDPKKIEGKITPRTKAIMPVHILGLPADMPEIMRIARKHNLVVLEDACQAHLAEINNKKVGTIGDAGCFSFQNSKNLPIGEGGAIVSDNDDFMDRCFSFNNYGNPYGSVIGEVGAGTLMLGTKIRTTEYQSAIGLLQMKNLKAQSLLRSKNADYLKSKISVLPGIRPYKLYDHVSLAVFHLFPFRIISSELGGMPKATFLKALQAEGIPCSGGYAQLNKMPYLQHALNTKNFKRMYAKKELDYQKFMDRNQCPVNDVLCNDQMIWLPQNLLLASFKEMDVIATAIEKIVTNAEKINERSK